MLRKEKNSATHYIRPSTGDFSCPLLIILRVITRLAILAFLAILSVLKDPNQKMIETKVVPLVIIYILTKFHKLILTNVEVRGLESEVCKIAQQKNSRISSPI